MFRGARWPVHCWAVSAEFLEVTRIDVFLILPLPGAGKELQPPSPEPCRSVSTVPNPQVEHPSENLQKYSGKASRVKTGRGVGNGVQVGLRKPNSPFLSAPLPDLFPPTPVMPQGQGSPSVTLWVCQEPGPVPVTWRCATLVLRSLLARGESVCTAVCLTFCGNAAPSVHLVLCS